VITVSERLHIGSYKKSTLLSGPTKAPWRIAATAGSAAGLLI